MIFELNTGFEQALNSCGNPGNGMPNDKTS